MRKMMFIAMTAAALFAGACKKKDDSTKQMDRAASTASKAQENVNDQAKDVRDEQKDVNKDQREMAKDQNDVAKQQGELNAAKNDLIQARDQYREAAKQRLAKIDSDIHQLEARTDAAARLKAERDTLSTKLDSMGNTTKADWDAFKKDVDDKFDKLENDTRDALKK